MLAHTFTAFSDKYGVSVAYATIPDKNISQECFYNHLESLAKIQKKLESHYK